MSFKGISFNVTLSDEQMEYIASLSADKVNQTKSYVVKQSEDYERQIKELENKITRMEHLLVQKDLRNEVILERLHKWRKKHNKLEEGFKKYRESEVN